MVCARFLSGTFLGVLFLLGAADPSFAQEVTPEEAVAIREYRVAIAFQKKKLFPQAAARWTTFLQKHPKDKRLPAAHLNLGVCTFGDRKFPEAAVIFKAVLAKYAAFDQRDRAQFNLGMCQYNIALALQDAADQKTGAPQVQANAAAVAAYKVAAVEFDKLVKGYAKSVQLVDALFYQAECLSFGGDFKAAIPVYDRIVKQHPKSPVAADAAYGLGLSFADLSQHEDARRVFDEFTKKFPKDERLHECRLRQGTALVELKRHAEAEKLFQQVQAVKESPYAEWALYQQALAVEAQNKLPQAAVLLESLPQRFPKGAYNSVALLTAGKCRFRANEFAPAVTSFTKVVALKDSYASEAAWLLGRSLILLNKPADAVKVLVPAIAAHKPVANETVSMLANLQVTRIEAIAAQPTLRKTTPALFAQFAAANVAHPRAAESLYRAAFVSLEIADFVNSKKYSESFLANARFAKHELTPELLFIAAESHLLDMTPDVAKAAINYKRLVAEFATSTQVPISKLRIGYCLYSQKQYPQAIAQLAPLAPTLKNVDHKAEAYLLLGRSQMDAKQDAPSVVAFRAAVTANPKWTRGDEVLLLLGTQLRATKDLNGARGELQKLDSQFKTSTYRDRAWFLLGEIALDQKQLDPAIAAFRKVAGEFPKSEQAPRALYNAASSLMLKPDFAGATAELSKLLSAYPTSDIANDGRYLRGDCQFQQKKYKEAAPDFQAFLAALPAAKPPEVVKVQSSARYRLALCQLQLNQGAAGIAGLEGLLKEVPNFEDADRAWYDLGFAYVDAANREKDAATAFQTLATKFPASPLVGEAWFRIGEIQSGKDQKTEAAASYANGLKAKTLAPNLRETLLYRLGETQYELKQFKPAGNTFLLQIKDFANGTLVTPAKFRAGECLHEQGEFTGALTHYSAVIVSANAKYLPNALYRAGDSAGALKRWAESQKFYDRLIKEFPKFYAVNEARFGLGLALQNQNQLPAAVKVYDEVTKKTATPTAAKCRFIIGEISFGQKKYEEACGHFLEVAVGYPEKEAYANWHALAHLEAGRCFMELKKYKLAQDELQTVVTKHPKHARVKDAQTLLVQTKQALQKSK
jgi:cellulose synthase operon protein C